jgi:hypothetical protein
MGDEIKPKPKQNLTMLGKPTPATPQTLPKTWPFTKTKPLTERQLQEQSLREADPAPF